MTLYTCMIDINTLDIVRDEFDDYTETKSYKSAEEAYNDGEIWGGPGYASFNNDGHNDVYAESLVSQEDADRLVREFCSEMAQKFLKAHAKLDSTKF